MKPIPASLPKQGDIRPENTAEPVAGGFIREDEAENVGRRFTASGVIEPPDQAEFHGGRDDRREADRGGDSWGVPAVRQDRLPPVFVFGYPSDVGGADTECWHTARLWRRAGIEVTFVPTWRPWPKWQARLKDIGCRTIRCSPSKLEEIPGLSKGVVVSFCNAEFLKVAGRVRELGCPVIWVNCMTWLFRREMAHYHQYGPFHAYVFQSHFQQTELQPRLAGYGVGRERCHLVRGAFCYDEFPYRPLSHESGACFVIGRLSRPDPDKFAAETWQLYGQIGRPLHARLMGWDAAVQAKLGAPPAWAECLPAGAEASQHFLRTLHSLVQINGGARENWPRVGLEAMAAGVPVIAENRWGWPEMIRHGETGYLCNNNAEIIEYSRRLARDEKHRLQIARRARSVLEAQTSASPVFTELWRRVLISAQAAACDRRPATVARPDRVGNSVPSAVAVCPLPLEGA